MGHVGDEVAPHLVGPLQIRDVVQHQHRAPTRGVACGRRACDEHAGIDAEGELDAGRLFTREGAGDLRHDVGMADRLGVAAADAALVDAEHPPSGLVHEPHPAPVVEHEDAFDHACENGFHPRAVAGQLAEPRAELVHRPCPGTGPRGRARPRRTRWGAA